MSHSVDVRTSGAGDPLMLIHGGVNRDETWRAQQELAQRWRLVIPARRGFPPSPPADRQDFAVDARDVGELLAEEPAHAVGFSYGGVGLAVAAGADPSSLRSITLIEPALFGVAMDRPAVLELMELSAAALGDDPEARERARASFEELAAIRIPTNPEQERAFLEARRLAPGLRQPGEAQPDLDAIAAAGVPALVVSGDHHPAMEAICDVLTERLNAQRAKLPGRGHAVQYAPGFNDLLERFLRLAHA